MSYQSETLSYEVIDRDIKTVLRERTESGMDQIEQAYDRKGVVVTLKGKEVRDYLNNIVKLLEYAVIRFEDYDDWEVTSVILKFLNNFSILRRVKDNFQIDGWKGEIPTFTDLLTLDIDKKTGVPFYGEIKSMIEYVKACKNFDKDNINRFFKNWTNSLNKLNITDYVTLLTLSNKKSLSELDIKKFEDIEESEIKVIPMALANLPKGIPKDSLDNVKETKIRSYYYDILSSLDFVMLSLISENLVAGTGFISQVLKNEKRPLIKNPDSLKNIRKYKPGDILPDSVILEKEFNSLLKNFVINDARFIAKQIEELFFRQYDIGKSFAMRLRVISVGIKTPYNTLSKNIFPEIQKDLKQFDKEEYYLVIRDQFNEVDEVKYLVVKDV